MSAIPADAAELAAWRKVLRNTLVARRRAVDATTLGSWRQAMDLHLERGFPGLGKGVLALCWPYRNEYDARHIAAKARAAGAVTALPVVVAPATPLIFREWHPGTALAKGTLGIPYPVGGPELTPDTVLLPMVGFDAAGYRLGYGGGFFDRTLAAMARRPVVIGVVHELGRLETIHPQPYDIAMDFVVTERGIYRRDDDKLVFLGAPAVSTASPLASPVCYAGELDPGYFGADQ
jgi:5,10-methenyltetrahydrofolate synthetase